MSTGQADEMNPNWARPQRQPRRGCGGFSCLVIGCGGVLLLCCGGGIGLTVYVSSWFGDDPAQVAAVCQTIAELEIPEGLEPAQSIEMNVPFAGQIGSAVIYMDKDGAGTLMLMALNREFAEDGSQESEDLQHSMKQMLQQPDTQAQGGFQVDESHSKEFTIRGEKAVFLFATGKNTRTGAAMIRVTGTFQGKAGPAVFQFLGDAEKYDEETLTKMIESIK